MKSISNCFNRLIIKVMMPILMVASTASYAENNQNNQPKLTPCYMEGLSDRLMCGSIAQPLSDDPSEGRLISTLQLYLQSSPVILMKRYLVLPVARDKGL